MILNDINIGHGRAKARSASHAKVPAIHVLGIKNKDVDARNKRGHDDVRGKSH